MRNYKSILTLTAILLLIAVLTLRIYYSGDVAEYEGEINLIGISDTVDIFTDMYGMPYIYAHNNEDLFFTAGYISARERLFQLTLLNAAINGNVATILGDNYLEHDKYIKEKRKFGTINLETIDQEYLTLLQAYCEGINSYIDNTDSLPLSFKITNARPIKWTIYDVVSVAGLMSNAKLSVENQNIIQEAVNQYFGESRSFNTNWISSIANGDEETTTIEELMLEYDILELLGGAGSMAGSSVFVVPSDLTENRKPVLIFEDIWGYKQPGKWFEISLNNGEYNVSGATLPGFPLPFIGKTETAAFAITRKVGVENINAMFDIAKNISIINTPDVLVDTSGYYKVDQPQPGNLESLKEKIQIAERVNINDIINILKESKNKGKAEQLKYILGYYNGTEDSLEIKELIRWDGDESSESRTALLTNTIYKNLVEGIFKDELSLIGDDIYGLFIKNSKFVETNLIEILNKDNSAWIDDINTINYKENLTDIINKAVGQSIAELKSEYGTINYPWGRVNNPKFTHLLKNRGLAKLFNKFDTKPVERSGSNSGININEFIYEDDLSVVSTVVLRKIYDLSNPNISYSILTTGQSGNPQSSHYADQLELYIGQDLRVIEHNNEKIKSSTSYQHLSLYPLK